MSVYESTLLIVSFKQMTKTYLLDSQGSCIFIIKPRLQVSQDMLHWQSKTQIWTHSFLENIKLLYYDLFLNTVIFVSWSKYIIWQ